MAFDSNQTEMKVDTRSWSGREDETDNPSMGGGGAFVVVSAEIKPDAKWPKMYRVHLSNGQIEDMVNLTRARDAARSPAKRVLHAEFA
jgi:hypothetical protein